MRFTFIALLAVFAIACQGEIRTSDQATEPVGNVSAGGSSSGASGTGPSSGGAGGSAGTVGVGGGGSGGGPAVCTTPCSPGSTCIDGVCVCQSGLLDCQGVCTNVQTDNNNCGGCSTVCAAGQSCQNGVCTCAGGLLGCGAACVNGQIDNANCGSCDNACGQGQSCANSTCTCLEGLTACPSGCANLAGDAQNCGSCGMVCAQGLVCSNGQCQPNCMGNQTLCNGNSCVDITSDAAHCNGCNNPCPAGLICQGSACTCSGSLTNCDGVCVETDTDPSNCGSCGNDCPAGRTCSGGSCVCVTGQACGSQCVDTTQDLNNCGSCNNVCQGGRVCSGGSCNCPGSQMACNGTCVDTQTNSSNCGSCGNACTGGRTCTSGSCNCPGGQTFCNGACVNLQTSATNCGSCGTTCGGGTCSNGMCTCSGGQTPCNNQCKNLQTDSQNCGSCGNQCAAGQTCSSGMCTGGTGAKAFSQCRFHFGALDGTARQNSGIRAQIDFFTPGWMGNSDTFDQTYVCNDTNPGAVLDGKVPVIVAYVAAFYVKRHHSPLCDCNVTTCGSQDGRPRDLCNFGSAYIQQDLSAILNTYRSFAQGYANCYGTTRPLIFEMEPDWYQYTGNSQTDPMTPSEAGNIMGQFVAAIKQYLPNAFFSMDISPWVAPNNGSDNGQQWYGNFNMANFTFIHTSGGGTLANNTKIRPSNNMTWAGVSTVTGKPILADTGYGAAGQPAGHDTAWDSASNINARINDGVISINQYSPNSNWGTTISGIRSQLSAPKFCP